MIIESIKIKNYKAFKNAEMTDIQKFCVIVGSNGSGKSTLFDVFGFLKDSMTDNITVAIQKRGGYKEVISRNSNESLEFEIKFRESSQKPLVTYQLKIGLDEGKPIVEKELLKYRRGSKGLPYHFLDFAKGKGTAVTNELNYEGEAKDLQREDQELSRKDILAIKGLAQFAKFPAAATFGNLIDRWYVSDFHISSARNTSDAGYAEHLSREGENLSLVTQFMFEQHKELFDEIMKKLKQRVPGISKVEAVPSAEGKILLKFQDGSFKDPFLSRYVSDGTIKMFAYLILLHDPNPHPLLCIEEPENQLYPKLLTELAEEFRDYANRGGQVFVSTHSPDFLNAIELDEVFWLVKSDGYTKIKRAKDDSLVANLMKEGDKMGYLWKQGLFEGVDPL
jgi:predicted ATPase